MNSGDSERKIKPIVNVRHYLGAKGMNNTAFYFKTDKNYYFVTVMKDHIHLGVEKVPKSARTDDTYVHYLTFAPTPLDKCPPMEPTDTNRVVPCCPKEFKRSAVSISNADQPDGKVTESAKSSASTPSSSSGSDPAYSPASEKFQGQDGVASADSGVESEAKEDENAPTPASHLVGGD